MEPVLIMLVDLNLFVLIHQMVRCDFSFLMDSATLDHTMGQGWNYDKYFH